MYTSGTYSHFYNISSNWNTRCSFPMCYYVDLLVQWKGTGRHIPRQNLQYARHEDVLVSVVPPILNLGSRRR